MQLSCKWSTVSPQWMLDSLPLKSRTVKSPACNSNIGSLSLSPRSAELSSRNGLGKTELCYPVSALSINLMRTKLWCTEDTRTLTPSWTPGSKLSLTERLELLSLPVLDPTLTVACSLSRKASTQLRETTPLLSPAFMTTRDKELADLMASSSRPNRFWLLCATTPGAKTNEHLFLLYI